MAKGNRVGVKGSNLKRIQQRGQDSEESDEEYKVTEDEDYEDSDDCYSLDGDESDEILADFEHSRRAVRSRSTRRTCSRRKGDEIKKPRKRRRVVYTKDEDEDQDDDDDDDDDDEDEDDDDDAEFMSLSRRAEQIKKAREKKRISYTELDEEEEEEDYAELVSSGRKRNQRKKHQRKKRVSDTEDDVDDDVNDDAKFMHSGRKVSQEKKLREKRKVSYTEDDNEDEDEDNSEFMSRSRKGNQTKETKVKRTVSYKEDNQEEEDENDAEFILSESDFVDYDDDSPKMKKNETISRHHPQKKSVVGGGQKNSKKSKIKKPTRPKQRNGQKSGSSKQTAATNKNPGEIRSKKIPRRRKQRMTVESDSDFVSSPSLDHEYTISEEEREQMREASVYCANLRAKLRSSTCGKHGEEPVFEQRKNPVRKGKEKVEDIKKDEVGKQVCGICLSEEGKRTVRGVLNCCRHYFCFSCIMEWSKVESRCPLCKQRFATITKAAKSDSGFDLRTVVIPVPECDQVYQPSEEELRGYLDPYESVICTECHHGGEDALMLLCDICDSPAHTFCVGLGREVPEGNWYCEGCRPTVFSSLNSDRRLSGIGSDLLPSPTAGGFDLNELYVPETPLTQQTRLPPEPRLPGADFMPAPAGTVATTLRDRRRIHRQMHHRLLNNNRTSDLVGRNNGTPPSSSSGIRLFGSQLDSTPQRNHIMNLVHDTNLFSPRVDPFGVQVQNSSLPVVEGEHSGGSGMGFDSRLGYGQLHPCTNRSGIGSDASLSPYACREAIGTSRTSAGGLHAPY